MAADKPTLIHVDDDDFCGDAVRRILEAHSLVRHGGWATTGTDGIVLCRQCATDVLLLDLILPDMSGFEVITATSTLPKQPRILLLTGMVNDATLFQLSRPQVAGLIWKCEFTPTVLLQAITHALSGRVYLSDQIRQALHAFRRDPDAFFKILSDRELFLLPLFGAGVTDVKIAEKCEIKPLTAKKHRANIIAKLGLRSSVELIQWCAENGFSIFSHPTRQIHGRRPVELHTR